MTLFHVSGICIFQILKTIGRQFPCNILELRVSTRDGEITVIIWKSLWLSRFTELIAFCFKIALNFRTNFLNERPNDV